MPSFESVLSAVPDKLRGALERSGISVPGRLARMDDLPEEDFVEWAQEL